MIPSPARPTFVLLHALGGSARSWGEVCARLSPHGTCLALDLPGFGDAADRITPAPMIDATLDYLQDAIAERVAGPWIVVGHSMGGKYATLLAAKRPAGLAGVVLIAASPPSPEPIDDDRRRDMLGWVADGPMGIEAAHKFLDANTAGPLPPDVEAQAITDLQRAAPSAWSGWLTDGVADDRSGDVPVLDIPAFILAGTEDGDLGIDNQRALNLPFYAHGVLRQVDGAAHLIPQEQPDEVAAYILALWHKIQIQNGDDLDEVTRRRLLERLDGPAPEEAALFTPHDRALLRAIVDRVVPQSDVTDIARRIEADLKAGQGDGWRFADLPADGDAFHQALDAIRGAAPDFTALPPSDQDSILTRIADGQFEGAAMSASQLAMWFEDLRARAVREWVGHPVTLARIGYDGLADPRNLPEGAMRA